jgi:hypothetical protein
VTGLLAGEGTTHEVCRGVILQRQALQFFFVIAILHDTGMCAFLSLSVGWDIQTLLPFW